jgi:hypothetical protein
VARSATATAALRCSRSRHGGNGAMWHMPSVSASQLVIVCPHDESGLPAVTVPVRHVDDPLSAVTLPVRSRTVVIGCSPFVQGQ